MMKKSKHFFAVAALVVAMFCAAVGGATFAAKADEPTYASDEVVMDIMEYVATPELARGGVTVSNEEGFLERDWINGFLSQSGGIAFKMKSSSAWSGTFFVRLGATQLDIVHREGKIWVDIYNKIANGWINGYSTEYDITAEHTWRIARIKSGSGCIVRVYIDGVRQNDTEDNNAMANGDNHRIYFWNSTGANLTFKSNIALPEFEEEKVEDVSYFNGNVALSTQDGLTVPYVHDVPNVACVEWLYDYLKYSNGVEFSFKSDAAWTQAENSIRVMLGTMDVRLNYNGGNPVFFVYNHAPGEALGGSFPVGHTFDSTAKHTLKVTRVKAKGGNGVLTRIYLDDDAPIEVYDAYPLATSNGGDLQAVRIYNQTGVALTVFGNNALPEFVAEKSSDILDFGGATALASENGKVYGNGDWVVEARGGWIEYDVVDSVCGVNGMEFEFKSAEKWAVGTDRIQAVLGATDVRLNKTAEGKFSVHIYNWLVTYLPWGAAYELDGTFDETQWNTFKFTQRSAVNGKGINVRVYINDELKCDVYFADGMLYGEQFRENGVDKIYVQDICLKNSSGKNVSFRSKKSLAFEDEIVQDLASVKNVYEQNYNESAFDGVNVGFGSRIINNVYSQEFVAHTNGLEFNVEPSVAGDKWITGGKEIILGDTETTAPWTISWNRSGDMWGNVDYWRFPAFFIKNNDRTKIYHKDNHDRLLSEAEIKAGAVKLTYQMHVDFGTTTIGFKELPDGRLVVNVRNRYTGIVIFDNVIATGFDSSAKNSFKISRVKADNNSENGFSVRIALNGREVIDAYDAGPLARSGEDYSHFLIDNISGVSLKVSNVRTFDEIKTAEKQSYAGYSQSDYSQANWAIIQDYIAKADADIDAQNSLERVKDISATAKKNIDAVWTLEKEAEFAAAQSDVKAAFDAVVAGKEYYEAQQNAVNKLLTDGKAAVDACESFEQLEAVRSDYAEKLGAVKTKEQMAAIVEARETAKAALNAYAAAFTESDYSAENFAEITRIKNAYLAEIEASENLDDIEAMPVIAKTQMERVETIAQAALTAKKTAAKEELDGYAKESDYTAENYETVKKAIERGKAAIDAAATEEEIASALSAAKSEIDAVAKIAKKGCNCGSAALGFGSVACAVIALTVAALLLTVGKRKRNSEDKR